MKTKTQKRLLPSCPNEIFCEEFLSKRIRFGKWMVTSTTAQDIKFTKRDFQKFKLF